MKKLFIIVIGLVLYVGCAFARDFSIVQALKIGQTYQGGIIGYILQPGDPGYIAGETHGLIVAPVDQGKEVPWYNGTYIKTGATGTALGTGSSNTNTIVSKQGQGNYAAKLCADLVIDGYSDWYLPSKDELDKFYDNKGLLGFSGQRYWSSSEEGNNNAWPQNFANGYQYHLYDKYYQIYVRAVRSF